MINFSARQQGLIALFLIQKWEAFFLSENGNSWDSSLQFYRRAVQYSASPPELRSSRKYLKGANIARSADYPC